MKLSIVIVNYNVKFFLEQCLHSVATATKNIVAEVWVVDNNSVDGSTEMLLEKFPEVKLIANKKNTGFSFANNQAIQQATGEFILLLNPDTVVEQDTFIKIIQFMERHPEAGAVGVKMMDGTGKFLPESKRGLPTPLVALFKMCGLAALFPKSKLFNRYHLGYLSKNDIHEVEILSGAFMFMRKTALDRVGLLDETFFMYGEDIDLSYRFIKAGYKNFYFPETRIIHYKGESTKKSSINYVFVFYEAMIIFAKKHFSQQNAQLFSFFINLAIYIRAAAAVAARFAKQALLPLVDSLIIYAMMYGLKNYWEKNIKYVDGGEYPALYMNAIVPAYVLVWVLSLIIAGAYRKKSSPIKIIKGIVFGTIFILVFYALLPESLRFSRAMILIGTVSAIVATTLLRFSLISKGISLYEWNVKSDKRIVIVGDTEETNRVLTLLQMTSLSPVFVGYVSQEVKSTTHAGQYLGDLQQLHEIIEIHKIDEVIFCAKTISSNEIINQMDLLANDKVEFKIAPPESLYIIGSNSINSQGDLYTVDINAISKTKNRRNKRSFDIVMSFVFIVFSIIIVWFQDDKGGFLKNVFSVLFGKKSWVGYKSLDKNIELTKSEHLPTIKASVLNPSDLWIAEHQVEGAIRKANLLYAKDYSIYNDLNIITHAFTKLGRQ